MDVKTGLPRANRESLGSTRPPRANAVSRANPVGKKEQKRRDRQAPASLAVPYPWLPKPPGLLRRGPSFNRLLS
jgi:hypothetical protein